MTQRNIQEIDRNLKIAPIEGDYLFYDVKNAPFRIYGLLEGYRRIPVEVAEATNPGVAELNWNTAGGRVRFRTDSAAVAIRVHQPGRCLFPHMTFAGSSGFDLYVSDVYADSFLPPIDRQDGYESVIHLGDRQWRDITVNFPLYDGVSALYIGIEPGASLAPGDSYRNEAPILFYGSSITQGGCASRPGNAYQAMISRRFNCDYRNLGFSGSARGEDAMISYLADQKMSLFFMDYDHNAPTVEHLAATHERLYLAVRKKQPDLPIIMASKTDIPRTSAAAQDTAARRAVVEQTYQNALAAGDKKVRFIDGGQVFRLIEALNVAADSCTVDGCHPNDLGFACMAKVFGDAIGEMLSY